MLVSLPDEVRDTVVAHLPCDEVPKLCTLDKAHRDMCNLPMFWQIQYAERHRESVARASAFRADPSVWPLEEGNRDQFRDECLFAIGRTVKTLRGHTNMLSCVAFSPDGRTLATGAYDNTAKLWDAQTGALRATLEGHDRAVFVLGFQCLAFSPDGRTLATGPLNRYAKLWDAQTGALGATLEHTGWVRSVAFSPDGRTLATGSDDNTAKLWGASVS